MKRSQFEDDVVVQDMRLERRRQRNRKAAALWRQRMREKMQHLEDKVEFLERRNLQLEKYITLLKSSVHNETANHEQKLQVQEPSQIHQESITITSTTQQQQQQQQHQPYQQPVIVTPRPNSLVLMPPTASPMQKPPVQVTSAFQMMPEPVSFDRKAANAPGSFANEEIDASALEFLTEMLLDTSSNCSDNQSTSDTTSHDQHKSWSSSGNSLGREVLVLPEA